MVLADVFFGDLTSDCVVRVDLTFDCMVCGDLSDCVVCGDLTSDRVVCGDLYWLLVVTSYSHCMV